MLRHKFKAGALQLTTSIAVVIALLLLAFILLVHTHKRFTIQTDFLIEATKIADRGFQYAFSNNILVNDTLNVSLNEEDYKSLKVQRDFWGVFEKTISIAKIKNTQFQKIGLVGATQFDMYRTALCLQDNNKPLVLVGNTTIQGMCYLPQQGVKPGTISGDSFYGLSLIDGVQRVSSKLPKLQEGILPNLKQMINDFQNVDVSQHLDLQLGNDYKNSFLEPTRYVYNNQEILLHSMQITGNIIIQSQSKITVHPSAKLTDVILIAPEIEIQNNTEGIFQALASKKITVGENVTLNYPSALLVNEKKEIKTKDNHVPEENIAIGTNSVVKGLVVYLGDKENNNYQAQIIVEKDALVKGEVYCQKNFELKGSIHGSVFTNNFIANESGSIYQNHIYNGIIKINELPQEYVGMLFEDSQKDILKWLY